MNSYRFNYLDVKNNFTRKVEREPANDEHDALEWFISTRTNDNWSHREIFNDSKIQITREDTNESFEIDALGQLARRK